MTSTIWPRLSYHFSFRITFSRVRVRKLLSLKIFFPLRCVLGPGDLETFERLTHFLCKIIVTLQKQNAVSMKTKFNTWSVCALSVFKDILACQADAQTPYSWYHFRLQPSPDPSSQINEMLQRSVMVSFFFKKCKMAFIGFLKHK